MRRTASIAAASVLALLALAPIAVADKTIAETGEGAGQVESPGGVAADFETGRLYVADSGNNRVDVFEADGTFVEAFGWGVDTKAKEFQACTTASGCTAGIAGAGAGQFTSPPWIAVDNDPLSPSQHSVYVGSDSSRVQKFDSEGNFLLAFGYDVIAHGPEDSTNDETQALTVNASGGSFKLKLEDTFSGANAQETAPLPFNAPAAEVAAALNALSTIGGLGGSVAVSGSSPYLIDFEANLAGDDVPTLEADGTALTGTTPSISVQEQHRGGALEVCDGKAGEVCKRGSAQPGGECEISRGSDPIGVGPGGEVYVADSYEAAPGSFTNRIERFDSEGNCLGEVELFKGGNTAVRNFAVDSGGNSYVTVDGGGGLLRKYGSSGALLYERGNSNDVKVLATEAQGIAVDDADNVFVKQRGQQLTKPGIDFFFTEYDSAGAIVKRFGYVVGVGSFLVPGLAAYSSPDGDLFASRGAAGVQYLSLPPPGPVVMPEPCRVKAGALGNTKATLQAEVNPEGKATTVRYEYISDADFDANALGGSFSGPNPASETPESESIGSDFEMHEASVQADLVPETEYHCRVVATNADAPGGITGPEGTFTSKPPLEFGLTSVTAVGTETATLNATVNPLGIQTSGYFEYVEETTYLKDIAELGPEHGFDHAAKVPDVDASEEPIDFGLGESLKLGSAQASGLKAGTAYRFRVVATDSYFPTGLPGPTKSFRTFGSGAGALPDDRAWELVSPAQKNSAEVAVPGNASGFTEDNSIRIQAGAGSGEAVTYTSFTSFGEAEGAPASSQYLSKRTASGWSTENISPAGLTSPIVPPYTGFSPDLRFGAVKTSETVLGQGCQEGTANLYLRDDESGAFTCLTSEPDSGERKGAWTCFTYAGASEDGSRAFFSAPLAFAGAPVGEGFAYNLYEWSATDGLQVVSVLPGESEAVAPTAKTSFGAKGGNCQTGLNPLHNVVSSDGRTAFWTYAPDTGPTQLLARINGEETIQLDAKAGGGKGGGDGAFLAASADGRAFFTAPGKLNSEAKTAGQLYRYDTVERTLLDITPGAIAPEVQGVVGASEDGSHLYFAAKGALTGEQENDVGQKALEGKNNLYLWHEGEGLRFIAVLSGEDSRSWESQPRSLSARVSPDGRHLAFLSLEAEALAGYDNTIAAGEHCEWERVEKKLVGSPLCRQAFLYDAETKELTCASCNPSGSRPLGPTLLPGWTNVYEGPRYLSDDGSRLFFESFDALATADENGKRDVYEFELAGKGSCTSESPAFDPVSGGCHSLISGGQSSDHSYLVDASSDGRDVFISTRSVLSGWDTNENYDVYDAREGGGFPEPSEQPICLGEACLPLPPQAPATSSPPYFEGPGNQIQKPKPCKGKKAKECRKHKAKKKHSKASHKRGAGR